MKIRPQDGDITHLLSSVVTIGSKETMEIESYFYRWSDNKVEKNMSANLFKKTGHVILESNLVGKEKYRMKVTETK